MSVDKLFSADVKRHEDTATEKAYIWSDAEKIDMNHAV